MSIQFFFKNQATTHVQILNIILRYDVTLYIYICIDVIIYKSFCLNVSSEYMFENSEFVSISLSKGHYVIGNMGFEQGTIICNVLESYSISQHELIYKF